MDNVNNIAGTVAEYFKTQPVKKAWLFGSFARGEETHASDVDILVSLDYTKHIGLRYFGMAIDLEKLLGRKVDLVEDGQLMPFAQPTAEKDKILIYERKDQRQGKAEHITEQINNIEEFVANKSLKDLENDKILQYAVIKCIEIIGEASYMLTNDFRTTHKEVEWEEIIRMRHVLVHGYYHISVMMVWEIIQSDLHNLKQQIFEYLK